MELKELNKEYDKLQKKYGAKELDSIYNGGLEEDPDVCFVFMNPTGRNIATSKDWKGLKAPWIGTKNIWDLFYKLELLDKELHEEIKAKRGKDWTPEFAEKVYEDVKKHKYFITNLGKCTQLDARELPDEVLAKYLKYLKEEITIINPKVVILFGNQVSSIVLDEKITVGTVRRKLFTKKIKGKDYKFYAVYYPVGNGRFNIDKAIEDIKWIIKHELVNCNEKIHA